MTNKLKGAPKTEALHDISEWLKEENIKIVDGNHDVWVVTGARLDTKEQRNLNKELGIHKVNKTADNMSRFKNES